MKFPEQFYNFTSENEGRYFFKLVLIVNKSNLMIYGSNARRRLENQDQDLYAFSWSVKKSSDLKTIDF